MKRKTINQLQKEARKAPKYVLMTEEFGYELYVADEEKAGSPVTLERGLALEFSIGYDNESMKLGYYKAMTGYRELQVKKEGGVK